MLIFVGPLAWHLGKSVQVYWYGGFAWRVSAWWLHWSECWASQTDHSYVQSVTEFYAVLPLAL